MTRKPSVPKPALRRDGTRLTDEHGQPGWHCRVWDAKAGRQKQVTFYGSERQAYAHIAKFRESTKAASTPQLPQPQYVTVGQWAIEFLRRYQWKVPPVDGVGGVARPKTTWRNARANVKAYIVPGLKPNTRLVTVTERDLVKLIGGLTVRDYTYTDTERKLPPKDRPVKRKPADPDTKDKAASITRLMFAEAKKAGILTENPAADLLTVWGATSRARRVVIPSLQQVETLACELDREWPGRGDIVRVFAYTALRWENLAALRWRDVDFERRSIHIWQSKPSSTGELYEGTKGGDDYYITMIDEAVEPLRRLKAFAEKRESRYVIVGERGGPLNYSLWRKHLNKARAVTGVPYSAHQLRHVCISLLIAGEASIERVSEQAGHKSTAVTQRVYRHAMKVDRTELAKQLRLPTTSIEVDEGVEGDKDSA